MRDKIIYETRQGPLDYRPCPFGGSGQIIIRESEDGRVLGKCELAEMVIKESRGGSFLEKIFSNYNPVDEMKKMGCPYPLKFHKLTATYSTRCKYNSGEWEEI